MGLQISKNKRHLEKEGSPFFYLADTCWSAFTNIDEPSWEYYLQYRRRQGYNTLQINILQQWDASETVLDNHPFALDHPRHGNLRPAMGKKCRAPECAYLARTRSMDTPKLM